MLRALNPEKDFQPKSKQMKPTKAEEASFSPDELESIDFMLKNDETLRLNRAVAEQQRKALLANMGVK